MALEQNKQVIDLLKEDVPDQHFPEFLNFAERILTSYCTTCPHHGHGKQRVGSDGGGGEESDHDSVDFGGAKASPSKSENVYEDMDDVMGNAPRDIPTQVVRTVTNTVRAGLTHPHIGGHLRRQLSMLIIDSKATPTRGGDREPLMDRGYNSRSDSGSSVPEI